MAKTYVAGGEDLNKLKLIAQRLVRTPFQKPWEYRLEIEGMPDLLGRRTNGVSTFDLLCKDISYGAITVETEAIKVGGMTITYPMGTEPVSLTLTIRDLKSRAFYRWFRSEWMPQMVTGDVYIGYGTFGVPRDYLRKVTRISLTDPDDTETWLMLPTKAGDVTESVDAEGFLETPFTLTQYRSIGG